MPLLFSLVSGSFLGAPHSKDMLVRMLETLVYMQIVSSIEEERECQVTHTAFDLILTASDGQESQEVCLFMNLIKLCGILIPS